MKKGVYPYEFMVFFEKFSIKLPGKYAFFSRLNNAEITDSDYEHALEVWKRFCMSNMGEYHDLYLKSDVLLLADVFEGFRKVCEFHYELDPAPLLYHPWIGMGCYVENYRGGIGIA